MQLTKKVSRSQILFAFSSQKYYAANSPTSTTTPDRHQRLPSQDASICSNFSMDDSSHSSSGRNGDSSNTSVEASQRRRKSKCLTHSDSKVGLNEIICGDLKNPNLVRIEVPLGKPIEEVYEGVHDGPVLGSGISGIVRLVKHRTTQVSYACKCLDLALIDSEEGLKQLKEEIYIMCQLVSSECSGSRMASTFGAFAQDYSFVARSSLRSM